MVAFGIKCQSFCSKALQLTNEIKISKNNYDGFMLMFNHNQLLKKNSLNSINSKILKLVSLLIIMKI